MTKNYNRHMKELDSGFYGKGFIRGLKMALTRRGRVELGYSVSRAYGGLKSVEIDTLRDRIAEEHPKIREDQAKQGLMWLLDVGYTPRGTVRKNSPFAAREENILRNFDHFELIGFVDVSSSDSDSPFFLPAYRVVSRSGDHFTYYAGSWQSGVPLTIV